MKQSVSLSSLLALLIVLPFVFSACSSDDEGSGEPVRPEENIIQIIGATEGLDSLESYLGQPNGDNIARRLSDNEYTLFAPNNPAFAKLLNAIGLNTMSELRRSLFSDILLYHIVANTAIQSNQLDSTVTAFNNRLLTLSNQGDSVLINPTTQPDRTVIVAPDIAASNGVIHVINEVILPEGVANNLVPLFGTLAGLTSTLTVPLDPRIGINSDLSTINAVFGQEGLLTGVLARSAPHTALVPFDSFFDAFFLPASLEASDIANYHIIPGDADLSAAGRTITTLGGEPLYVTNNEGQISLNGATVIDFGYSASNGRLLFPLRVLSPAVPLLEAIEVVQASTGLSFSLFNAALEQTELDLGTGKTIFVPTDQAFRDAGLVTSIDSAARIDPALLSSILQAHVIEGLNFSSDLAVAGTVEATSLNEVNLTVTLVEGDQGNSLRIQDGNEDSEDATVIFPDNLTNSGVVHVIDKLLLPNP